MGKYAATDWATNEEEMFEEMAMIFVAAHPTVWSDKHRPAIDCTTSDLVELMREAYEAGKAAR